MMQSFSDLSGSIILHERNFRAWYESICSFAQGIAHVQDIPAYEEDGMLCDILDDVEWTHLHTIPNDDPDAAPIITPRPVIHHIADVQPNAGPGTRHLHAIQLENRKNILTARHLLRQHVEISVGPDFMRSVFAANPSLTGVPRISTRDIVDAAKRRYRVLTHSLMNTLVSEITTPANPNISFDSHVSSAAERFRALEFAGCSTPEPLKLFFFLQSLFMHEEYHRAVQTCMERYPALADQSFSALCDHVRLALANKTAVLAHAAGMVANVTGLSTPSPARHRASTPNQRHARRPSSPPSAPTRGSLYCHHHGYVGHAGTACQVMLARPGTYTQDHLTSTRPTLEGASTYRK